MTTRYQVFISSTYIDLQPEREQVIKSILKMGHIPVGMEMFNADDAEQWVTIKREIDRSDYYVLLIAHRYGSVMQGKNGISYTEKEFDYAGEVGVPRVSFVIKDGVPWDPAFIETDPKVRAKLEKFKRKAKSKPVGFWKDASDLGLQVALSLQNLMANHPRPGWERASADSGRALATMSRLSDENARLNDELTQLRELTAVRGPQLDCQFVGSDGKLAGAELLLSKPDRAAVEQFREWKLAEISALVEQIDNFQKSTNPAFTSIINHSILAALQETYTFDYKRLEKVKGKLKNLGLKPPTRQWRFENLKKESRMFQVPSMPGVAGTYNSQPVTGDDYPRYVLFAKLEEELKKLESECADRLYKELHDKIKLRLLNVGTVAAEDFTLRVDFPEALEISDDTEDMTPRKKLKKGVVATHSHELLVPDETMNVLSFTLGKTNLDGDYPFTVRITGRNLSRAQYFTLTLKIGDAQAVS